MGREVRRVPANWEHPRDEKGKYIPLFGGSFSKRLAEWELGNKKWKEGFRSDFPDGWKRKEQDEQNMSYIEWAGEKPEEKDHMPDWPESEKTHLQMYEDTSEGTPISPVMETPEELARWLADTNASAFGEMTATYNQWLATIRIGYAVGGVLIGKSMYSGVEYSEEIEKERRKKLCQDSQ